MPEENISKSGRGEFSRIVKIAKSAFLMFFSRCLELEAVLGNGNCWHRFDCLHFTEQSTKPKPALVEGGGRVQNTKTKTETNTKKTNTKTYI